MKTSWFQRFLAATIAVVMGFSVVCAFDDAWEEAKPDGDLDYINTGDDQMRQDKRALRQRLEIDHDFRANETGITTIGYHKAVHLIDQVTDALDNQTLYNKNGTLVWHDKSGNKVRITTVNGTIDGASLGNLANITSGAGKIPAANLDAPPTGAVIAWSTSTAPTGWLLCDGSAVSRTTYATLFSVIGTTYGAGDGSTTFNVPNLKGKIPVGYSTSDTEFDTLGKTGGEKTHLLTASESGLPAHSHLIPARWREKEGVGFSESGSANIRGNGVTNKNDAVSASSSHNNLQPYLTMNYIIKT
jgi:microcystin-dependent protein